MGKIVASLIVIVSVLFGAGLWYSAERAYYLPVAFTPGAEIRLMPVAGDQPEPILVSGIQGIDADSSPIKFRACFSTPMSMAMLTETYVIYDDAVPLIAPSNFPCFDAQAIGQALETGAAIAFLSEPEIHPGVDRVVAVFADGRAFAWHQINDSLKD